MTDEQRVRNALDYEIEPWTPDPADLIRRGRRGAWVRRGAMAGAVVTVAGSVAGVSMAIGGPQLQQSPVGGGGDSTPSVLTPTPIPEPTQPAPTPTRPTRLPATPSLPPTVTERVPERTPTVNPPTPVPTPTVREPSRRPATPSLPPQPTRSPRLIEPTPNPTEPPATPGVPTVIDSGK
jgi:hypothetical protein